MASERELDRIRKLLARADERSNDNKNEREQCAIEAVRLINTLSVEVIDKPPPVRVPRRRAPPAATIRPRFNQSRGTESRARGDEVCIACGSLIDRGDPIWIGVNGVVHLCWPEWPCSNQD